VGNGTKELTICPSCQSVAIGSVDLDPKSKPKSAYPVPIRGALRGRHERGTGCGGRGGVADERHSSGRRSRVVLTPRRWRQVSRKCPRGDGDNKARSPGRSRRKPLKPLRREGRVFRRTCGFYPCAFLLHRGLRVRQAPGFPCALCFRRDDLHATTRARAAGRRTHDSR